MKIIFYVCAFSGFIFSACAQDTIPPVTPSGVTAVGYEKHIDLEWYNNSEPDLAGYKIYRRVQGQYYFYTNVSKEKSYLMLSLGGPGSMQSFKVSAYDNAGNESPLSDTVTAITHVMNNEEFLDMVQRATFRYFWDYAHPVSGMIRERLGSGDVVTTGGSGFGIMALLAGIERGYIPREHGAQRLLKILNFLTNNAQRFHGAFSHWLNGSSGQTIPFSTYDDGGDLVETSFMVQGLLAARQYFDGQDSSETQIRNLITQIWEGVEWSWYRRTSFSNYLYWHWSPNYGWQMNLKLVGYNETMITYLLAIASPTYPVPSSLYYSGWASSSGYFINQTYYNYKLWVGDPYGGPLFFAHYSFLGFDPRNKHDNYCNYFMNNRNHTLINRQYCIVNPGGHAGYGADTWGLTASDNPWGYSAQEPYTNDNGTITPTAAISSIPYTPEESLSALKNFYRTYYSNLWGEYGFKDAFNPDQNWFAQSYLAIDQGPIIDMIENYRSGLLWNKFMSDPGIQPMLDAIGFQPDSVSGVNDFNSSEDFRIIGTYPNPFNPDVTIEFNIPKDVFAEVQIYNTLGEKVKDLYSGMLNQGDNKVIWNGKGNESYAGSGVYFYRITADGKTLTGKIVLQK